MEAYEAKLMSQDGSKIFYPHTVSDLVRDNDTGKTVKEQIESLLKGSNKLLGVTMSQSDLKITPERGINATTGSAVISTLFSCTDYISVDGAELLKYSRIAREGEASTTFGMVFYDESKKFISGQSCKKGGESNSYEPTTIEVPSDAKYVRFTLWTDESYGQFEVSASGYIDKINNLEEKAELLYINTESLNEDLSVEGKCIGADGNERKDSNTENKACTDFISCANATEIEYTRFRSADQSIANDNGLAFYDSNKNFISFVPSIKGVSGYEINKITPPTNAAFVRTSYWNEDKAEEYGKKFYLIARIKGNVRDFSISNTERISILEKEASKINPLKDEVTELQNNVATMYVEKTKDLSDIPFSNRNGYLMSDGRVNSTGTLATYTDFIDCEGYDTLEISVIQLTTSPSQHLCFYNNVNELVLSIPRLKGSVNAKVIKTYEVPEGAVKFRTTYFNAENQEIYGAFYCKLNAGVVAKTEILEDEIKRTNYNVSSLGTEVTELSDRISDASGADGTLRLNQQDIVELNVINALGATSANTSMGCTDYIPCKNAKTITYKQVVGTSGSGLAFYDENKSFISYIDSVGGSNGYVNKTVDVPGNACFFRASGWNYVNSKVYGEFSASLFSIDCCLNGMRASNGESTFFSVFYNSAHISLDSNTFETECLPESLVCTTGVVLLPPSYSMKGKPSRVIINFHGWSHYVNYKQWGAAGDDYLGFMKQKHRWAEAGYVVIDVNHKNSSQKGNYSGIGSIQDDECYRKCLEWVRANYNVEDTCFIVCGSAGGPNGINACYNWSDVRAGVWLDTWVDVKHHYYETSCGNYYYGYNSDSTEDEKDKLIGTRNPIKKIFNVGGTDYLALPKCPVLIYPLNGGEGFLPPLTRLINSGKAINGDVYIRKCSGISHSNLVSGGAGNDPQSEVVDAEIIHFLNQH